MWHKKFLFSALTILGVLCSYAQTRLINNITYEKIGAKWYQLYNSRQYEVDKSIVTVKFVPGLTESQKNTIAQNNLCTILRSNSLGYYDLQITSNKSAVDVVEDLLANSSIAFAEPNTIGEFTAHANDTYYWDQWHLQGEEITGGIDAYKAWDKENGNPNITIAILDSGTDILHEDLKGNIWVNPGEDLDGDGVVWDLDDMNGIDDDGNGLIDDLSGWDFENNNNDLPGPLFHGTRVAGIVGSETNDMQGVAGVAGGWTQTDKGCKMLIGAISEIGINSANVDDAILYAVEKGAKIITLSFGIGYSAALENTINSVYINNNCFIDCSSGNNGLAHITFPANVQHCFAVGASNQNKLKVFTSSFGTGLMVVAPGVDIKSTVNNNTYGTDDGTSFSSPQVAATAGLILSRYPDFTAKDIEEVVCLTAAKISPNTYTYVDGYEYGSWNYKVGYGKLNADRAIGIKEDITSNLTLKEGNYICNEVHISNNSTLTLSPKSRFYLLKTGKLIVDAGSTLIIEDNVTINGNSSNKIIVNGNIQIGQNVTFNKYGNDGSYFDGLVLNNNNAQITMNNIVFNNTNLKNYGTNIEITNSEFYNSDMEIQMNNAPFEMNKVYFESTTINHYGLEIHSFTGE